MKILVSRTPSITPGYEEDYIQRTITIREACASSLKASIRAKESSDILFPPAAN
jgi:hypothetical protein